MNSTDPVKSLLPGELSRDAPTSSWLSFGNVKTQAESSLSGELVPYWVYRSIMSIAYSHAYMPSGQVSDDIHSSFEIQDGALLIPVCLYTSPQISKISSGTGKRIRAPLSSAAVGLVLEQLPTQPYSAHLSKEVSVAPLFGNELSLSGHVQGLKSSCANIISTEEGLAEQAAICTVRISNFIPAFLLKAIGRIVYQWRARARIQRLHENQNERDLRLNYERIEDITALEEVSLVLQEAHYEFECDNVLTIENFSIPALRKLVRNRTAFSPRYVDELIQRSSLEDDLQLYALADTSQVSSSSSIACERLAMLASLTLPNRAKADALYRSVFMTGHAGVLRLDQPADNGTREPSPSVSQDGFVPLRIFVSDNSGKSIAEDKTEPLFDEEVSVNIIRTKFPDLYRRWSDTWQSKPRERSECKITVRDGDLYFGLGYFKKSILEIIRKVAAPVPDASWLLEALAVNVEGTEGNTPRLVHSHFSIIKAMLLLKNIGYGDCGVWLDLRKAAVLYTLRRSLKTPRFLDATNPSLGCYFPLFIDEPPLKADTQIFFELTRATFAAMKKLHTNSAALGALSQHIENFYITARSMFFKCIRLEKHPSIDRTIISPAQNMTQDTEDFEAAAINTQYSPLAKSPVLGEYSSAEDQDPADQGEEFDFRDSFSTD